MELNKDYLTAAERARVEALQGLRRIFEGRHRDQFYARANTRHCYKALGPNARNVLYITENLAGRCSLKYADLLFGEPLGVEAAGDSPAAAEAVERIASNSRLHERLFGAAAESSWAGSAFWQCRARGGAVVIQPIAPEHVFPAYGDDAETLASAEIKYVATIGGVRYARVIRHLPGLIEHELWELAAGSNEVKARADTQRLLGAPPAEPTGVGELCVVEVPNYAACGRGASDYAGDVADLFDEVNNRISQISRVLDTHADPIVQALESLFDRHGNLQASGRALATGDMTQDAVRYVTWDANLEQAFAALASARDAALGQMDMAPELLGRGAGTSADSWKKFKLCASQTLARVNRKRIHMAPAIVAAFRVAMLLENAWVLGASYPVADVSLAWNDGLPEDETEKMQVVTGYVGAGLMSTRRALMEIHNDPAIVEEELAELAAEAEADLPTGFRDGMMALGDRQQATGNRQQGAEAEATTEAQRTQSPETAP